MRPLILMLLLIGVVQTQAAIRYVDAIGGPNHYPTINEAYTAAVNGDTLLLGAAAFSENLTSTKQLTILGVGFDQTLINGTITFNAGSSRSVLEGVRVSYMVANATLIGIASAVDSLIIRRCYVTSGTVYATIIGRTAATTGRLYITDCILQGCPYRQASQGFLSLNGDTAAVSNCLFASNNSYDGGTVRGIAGTLSVRNCCFVGLPRLLDLTGSFAFMIENCVMYDGTADWGTYPAASTWSYNASSVAAPPGSNSILLTQNPFVTYNTTSNFQYGVSDLHLNGTAGGGAACVDAGDPVLLDLDGSRSDLGIYGGQTPLIDSGAPNYPYVQSLAVPPSVTVGNPLQIESAGRIGRGY